MTIGSPRQNGDNSDNFNSALFFPKSVHQRLSVQLFAYTLFLCKKVCNKTYRIWDNNWDESKFRMTVIHQLALLIC